MKTLAQRLTDIEEVWLENEGDVSCISNKYGISQGMVYYTMRKFCTKNGKVYQSYLRYPHKQHERHICEMPARALGKIHWKEPVIAKTNEKESDISELLNSSNNDDVLAGIDLLIKKIEKEIYKEWEQHCTLTAVLKS